MTRGMGKAIGGSVGFGESKWNALLHKINMTRENYKMRVTENRTVMKSFYWNEM